MLGEFGFGFSQSQVETIALNNIEFLFPEPNCGS